MQIKMGVFGTSMGAIDKEILTKALALGEAVAKEKCILITGATVGIPYAAAEGAKEEQGLVVGISPANNLQEHTKVYKMPTDFHDIIIYTGMGYEGRNLFNIKTADICLFLQGGIGTLNEFTLAYKEEKIIGVLKNTGGISEIFPEITYHLARKNSTKIIYEDDPKVLVRKCLGLLK
ncbi:LOG family protein [Candidatus Woesearchaeota archaeon]|nr:LOG family protein [Candidatus Woesearchaeota archaeon]